MKIPLNKQRVASYKINMGSELASYLTQAVSFEPVYSKFYHNGILMFHGPIASLQEAGDEASNAALTVNCTGPEFIWGDRVYSISQQPVKLAAGTARAAKWKTLLESYKENEAPNNRTFIDYTTRSITGGGTGEFEVQAQKTLAEILSELVNSIEGFDWTIFPTEAKEVGGVMTIGQLETQEDIGKVQPNAVFEWGGSRDNLASYNRTVDVTTLANEIFSIGPAGPEAAGSPTQTAKDVPSQETWQLRQAMAPLSALSTSLRLKLAEEALAVRKKPRQTLNIVPIVDAGSGLVPTFGVDYNLGDTIRTRVLYNGLTHLDVSARMWGTEYTLDGAGKEGQSILLSEE